jgi:hypothetical protein
MLFWFLKKKHDFLVINANGIRFHLYEAFFQPTCYGGVYFTNDKSRLGLLLVPFLYMEAT